MDKGILTLVPTMAQINNKYGEVNLPQLFLVAFP